MRFLSLALLLLAVTVHFQAHAQWDPIYNGRRYTSPDLDVSLKTVVRTLHNGDALLMRYNASNQIGQQPARYGPANLVRVDSNGHIRWSKQILPPSGDSSILAVGEAIELSSGKIIVHGLSEGYKVFVILCLSAEGDMLWCKKGALPASPVGGWLGNPIIGNMALTPSEDGFWFILPTETQARGFRVIKMDTLGQVQAVRRYDVPTWAMTIPIGLMPSGNNLLLYAGGSATSGDADQVLALRADAAGVPQQAIATLPDTSPDRLPLNYLSIGRMPGKGAIIAGGWQRFNQDGERLLYIPESLQHVDELAFDSLMSPNNRPDIYSVADGEGGVSVAGFFGHVFLDSTFRIKTVSYAENGPNLIMLPAAGAGANRHYSTIGGIDAQGDMPDTYLQQKSMPLLRLSNKADRPNGAFCGSASVRTSGLRRISAPSAPFTISQVSHTTESYTLTSLNPVVRNFPLCEVDNCNWHFFLWDIDLVDSTGLPTRQYTFPNPFFASGGIRFSFSNGDTGRTVTLAIPDTVTCTITGPCGNYQFDIRIRALPTALRHHQPAGKVMVAPNPASKSLRLYGLQTDTKFCMLDAVGRTVMEKQASPEQGISVEHLPRGVYQWQCAGQKGRLVLE